MNERVVPKITNFCVVKLSNNPANTQHREVPVPRRQDVDERPYAPRLELNGPALRHFESQPDSPRTNQRFLNSIFVIPAYEPESVIIESGIPNTTSYSIDSGSEAGMTKISFRRLRSL